MGVVQRTRVCLGSMCSQWILTVSLGCTGAVSSIGWWTMASPDFLMVGPAGPSSPLPSHYHRQSGSAQESSPLAKMVHREVLTLSMPKARKMNRQGQSTPKANKIINNCIEKESPTLSILIRTKGLSRKWRWSLRWESTIHSGHST